MTATPSPSPLPRLLTAKDVSEQTGMPLQSVYGFAKAGILPHVRIGHAVRNTARAVEAWIESGGASDAPSQS